MPLNRRQWLKTAGLATGAMSIFGNSAAAAIPSFHDFLEKNELHHLPPGLTVKLSSNENPYGPSPKVRETMSKAFDKACRYPWAERDEITQKIAKKEGVTPDHVLVTVGSTEGLKITALAYLHEGGEVVAADPTFEAMLYYAERMGAYVNRVPVDENLGLDLGEMERRCNSNTRLVFVCNPNNPTGTILPANQLRDFCESMARQTIVFSDEAYYDYISEPNYPSMVELVKRNLNVVVSRTFSKVYGMAGLRIGYLVARPDIIERIEQFQVDRPNMLALYAASAAIDETDFYRYSLDMNAKARRMICDSLDALKLPYVPSHTNFVFFKTGRDIGEVNAAFREQGVQVGRPFPPLTDWCRVSTGKLEEVEVFQKAVMKVFG
jgi:histidinol-phosphate aminotransferase